MEKKMIEPLVVTTSYEGIPGHPPRTYSRREWEADTDQTFILGVCLGAFFWSGWRWYVIVAYAVFLLAFFAGWRAFRRRFEPALTRRVMRLYSKRGDENV